MPNLHPHIGQPAGFRRLTFFFSAVAIAASVFGGHASCIFPPLAADDTLPVPVASAQKALGSLDDTDRAAYSLSFSLQKDGRYEEADQAAAHANSSLLTGSLLAQRYLDPNYKPRYETLAAWLAKYPDYPQASDIYRLMLAHRPENAPRPDAPQQVSALKGFTSGHERSELATVAHNHWNLGLAAFRRHDLRQAFDHLRVVAEHSDDLPSDDRAAAYFWAYRAALGIGDDARARKYLSNAAEEQPGFYSILARELTGDSEQEKAGATQARLESVAPMLQNDAVKRAIALKAVGEDGLAEQELRHLFPGSGPSERKQLVTLARMLNLPGAQMRMALVSEEDTAEAGEAIYPMPRWTPTVGYRLEPALIFAIMRQESGFNPNARSANGAQGVMQLMPATAHAMARGAHLASKSIEPSVSMALGQTYIESLMDSGSIGNNLIYMIAAYNAGPGTVSNWQRKLHGVRDPLLFVESLPCVQTRDYIVRVMGNYWIYSKLMGAEKLESAAALAKSAWPRYEETDEHLASMLSRLGGD